MVARVVMLDTFQPGSCNHLLLRLILHLLSFPPRNAGELLITVVTNCLGRVGPPAFVPAILGLLQTRDGCETMTG